MVTNHRKILDFQTFRFTSCNYPLNKADGYIENILMEDECQAACQADGYCHNYIYNPGKQACFLYHVSDEEWKRMVHCNKIVGPPSEYTQQCFEEMSQMF